VHAGVKIDHAYRPDIIVDRCLVIEVKSVALLLDLHKQQLSTYLRLAGIKVGLLINFNVAVLRHGIRRVLLDL
jgi:GxxExxY protein